MHNIFVFKPMDHQSPSVLIFIVSVLFILLFFDWICADSSPWSGANKNEGVATKPVERQKETTCPELVVSDRLVGLTLACETRAAGTTFT